MTLLDLEGQEAFRRNLFEASSKSDERPVFKIQKDWSIVDSVSMGELARVLHDSEESAPGSDMITLKDLKSVSPAMLVAAYNMWL